MAGIELSEELCENVLRWQQYLHRIPELGFEEAETTRFLEQVIGEMEGAEARRPAKTGLVAVVRGQKPGRLVAYRADIDALPIEEELSHTVRSLHPGVMHACGHDGHMAIALGALKYFSEHRETLSGSIRFIFQPAEETPPGGAAQLVEAGVLEGVSAIVGCHLESKGEAGKVYVLPGAMLAATNTFSIEILGRGGHAASPHQTIDPLLVGAHIVTALQGIVSRRRNPLERIVLSVTQFHAGSKDNIIPQIACLNGTVRVLDEGADPGYSALIPQWMEETVRGVAQAFGAQYRFSYQHDYARLFNDHRAAELVRRKAVEIVGADNVLPGDPNMAGDDMGVYLQKLPGCYYVIGCRMASDDGVVYPNHHPRFLIDPHSLITGVSVAVSVLQGLIADTTI